MATGFEHVEIWELGLQDRISLDLSEVDHAWELPYGERAVLAGLCLKNKVRNLLEIGTFRGSTAVLFARLGIAVHTVDLPAEAGEPYEGVQIGEKFAKWERSEAGSYLVNGPGGEIFFHRTGSVSHLHSHSFDMAFVDGEHTEEGCTRDTRAVLSLVRPGGLIVWDDAEGGASFMGCATAIKAFGAEQAALGNEPVKMIHGTRLATWRKPLHQR